MVRVIYASSRARHFAIGTPQLEPILPSTFALRASVDNLRLARRHSLACQPKFARAFARERRLVGLTRFELVTPRLSSVCSNQLSYRPPTSPAFGRLRRGRL